VGAAPTASSPGPPRLDEQASLRTLVALALTAHIGQHFLVRRLFRVRGPAIPGLIPLRDALGFAIWLSRRNRRHRECPGRWPPEQGSG